MPKVLEGLAAARAEGDLSENAEYHGRRETQAMLEARIGAIRDKLSRAVLVDPSQFPKDQVSFGCTVVVKDLDFGDEEEFTLVGAGEEDYDTGKILVTSPLAQGLNGKKDRRAGRDPRAARQSAFRDSGDSPAGIRYSGRYQLTFFSPSVRVAAKSAGNVLQGIPMFHRIWNYVWQRLAEDLERLAGRRRLPAQRGDGLLCGLFALSAVPGADLHPGLRAAALAAGRRRPGVLLEQVKQQVSPWLADQLQALLAGVKSNAGLRRAVGGRDAAGRRDRRFPPTRLHVRPHFRHAANSDKKPTIWWGYVRTVLYDRLSAFLMLLAVGALLLGLFVANVYVLAAVRMDVENWLPGGAPCSPAGPISSSPPSTNALLFALIYKVLPKVTIRWREPWPAGCWSRWSGSSGSVCWCKVPDRAELHGLWHRRLVHRRDDLGLLCQRHPLSWRRVRRGPLDRRGPEQKAGSKPSTHGVQRHLTRNRLSRYGCTVSPLESIHCDFFTFLCHIRVVQPSVSDQNHLRTG